MFKIIFKDVGQVMKGFVFSAWVLCGLLQVFAPNGYGVYESSLLSHFGYG
jgi:hypothetical protein